MHFTFSAEHLWHDPADQDFAETALLRLFCWRATFLLPTQAEKAGCALAGQFSLQAHPAFRNGESAVLGCVGAEFVEQSKLRQAITSAHIYYSSRKWGYFRTLEKAKARLIADITKAAA